MNRKQLWIITGLFLAVLGLETCSERERLNPFDPRNPTTRGAPTGVSVWSHRDSITLSWNPMDVDHLEYYQVYRAVDSADFSPPAILDFRLHSFVDHAVEYDRFYRYTVQAVTAFDSGARSDTVGIIPGPHNIWITDYFDYSIYRLSYDGIHVLGRQDAYYPIAIAAYIPLKRFLVARYWSHTVETYNRDLSLIGTLQLPGTPVDLCVDGQSGTIYVLLRYRNQLLTYTGDGDLADSLELPLQVGFYTCMDYDSIRQTIWISGDSILRIDLTSPITSLEVFSQVEQPGRIYADPREGGCWVATSNGVVRLDPAGGLSRYKEGFTIRDISPDRISGDCYYSGYSNQTAIWETGRIIPSEGYRDELLLGNEYPDISRIKVVPGLQGSGFLVIQKIALYSARLVRFDSRGSRKGVLQWFGHRVDIALE